MLGDLRGSSQSVIKRSSLLLSLKTNQILNGTRHLPPNTVSTCMLLRRNSLRVRIYSGAGNSTGFSPSPFFAFEAPISCVSWNARALAHHNLQLRQQKVNEVLALRRQYTVVALVEVHGSLLAQQSILARCLRSHFLLCSQVENCHGLSLPDAGGICILVARSLFGPFAQHRIPSAHLLPRQLHLAKSSVVELSNCPYCLRASCRKVSANHVRFSFFITLVFPLSLPGTL